MLTPEVCCPNVHIFIGLNPILQERKTYPDGQWVHDPLQKVGIMDHHHTCTVEVTALWIFFHGKFKPKRNGIWGHNWTSALEISTEFNGTALPNLPSKNMNHSWKHLSSWLYIYIYNFQVIWIIVDDTYNLLVMYLHGIVVIWWSKPMKYYTGSWVLYLWLKIKKIETTHQNWLILPWIPYGIAITSRKNIPQYYQPAIFWRCHHHNSMVEKKKSWLRVRRQPVGGSLFSHNLSFAILYQKDSGTWRIILLRKNKYYIIYITPSSPIQNIFHTPAETMEGVFHIGWDWRIIFFMILMRVIINDNLVGGIPTPLKNIRSSVGVMKFPTEWEVIIHSCSSHHQPVLFMVNVCNPWLIYGHFIWS